MKNFNRFRPSSQPILSTGRASVKLPTLIILDHGGSSKASQNSPRNEPILLYLEGTVMTDRGLVHLSPNQFEKGDLGWFKFEEALESVGSFFAVFEDPVDADLLVVTDFHGFQPLFYYRGHTGSLVISSSFMALVQELRKSGSEIAINPAVVAGQFGSFNALLNHHAFTVETIVEDIWMLRPDQYLRLSSVQLHIESRERFNDPCDRTYDELIDEAIVRGADFVRAASKWSVPERMLYLSGGRDSRSVLAMVIAADAEKEFPVFAKNPPATVSHFSEKLSIDRTLAGCLINEFDLEIWEDNFTASLPNRSADRKWWLSHWAGISSDYNRPGSASLVPSIRLIGAMGENYRTKVPDFVGSMGDLNFSMEAESFERDFDLYFNRIAPLHPGEDSDAWERLRENFHSSLQFNGVGSALWERLDAFSEIFRMPAHFGGTVVEQSINVWNLNVLAIPELTYAASKLERDERASGKVWKNLHDRVDGRLNKIPFEFELKAGAGTYLRETGASSNLEWKHVDELHSQNLEKNSREISHLQFEGPGASDPDACVRLLKKHREVIQRVVGRPRMEHLDSRLETRTILLKRMRGKLELLDELLDPTFWWSTVTIRIRSSETV